MFLRIDVPPEWTTRTVEDGQLHQHGDTTIHALRIRELPVDVGHWMERSSLRGAPVGSAWTQVSRAELQTVDGWDALLSEIRVEHETFRRVRIAVLYKLLDYGAGAIVDVDADGYEGRRAELLDLLGKARPMWGPQNQTCLATLLGGAHHELVTLAMTKEIKSLVRGWRRTYSGDGVVLSVPNGAISLRPGITPLRAADEVWRPLVPRGATVEGPLGLVSSEGDYGVVVNAIAGPQQTTIAVLYGEYHYALIHARTTDASLFETFVDLVRRLAHTQSLGLGVDRRRPYLYDPPPGWTGVARPLSTLWLSPDCGRDRATLQVFHSRPHRSTAPMVQYRQLFEQLSREFGETPPAEPKAFENRFGIRGQLVTRHGVVGDRPTNVSDAGMTEGRNLYLVRLEAPAEHHAQYLGALQTLVASVQPLPAPKADVDTLIEWFAAT